MLLRNYLPLEKAWPFISINLTPHHLRMLCAKFGWNWPGGSGEEDLKNLAMFFCYYVIISYLERTWPFFWTNLNPHHPKMLCAKFGWNWPSGSGDGRRWKCEKYTTTTTTTTMTTTDNRQIVIRKAHLSLWSGELKKVKFMMPFCHLYFPTNGLHADMTGFIQRHCIILLFIHSQYVISVLARTTTFCTLI